MITCWNKHTCMVIVISMATDEMEPAALQKVVKFHRKVRAGKKAKLEALNEDGSWAVMVLIGIRNDAMLKQT